MSQIPPLPLESLNGGLDWVILAGKRPGYPFKDGKRLSDTPEKYNYDVKLPGNCYAELTVSIPGSMDALAAVSEDDIAGGCGTLRPILVRFSGCIVKVYTIKGEQRMSATASGIELVKPSK